eukprot:COSAG03_NODE_934_length_5267_cov_19.622485_1_plen_84_part_10
MHKRKEPGCCEPVCVPGCIKTKPAVLLYLCGGTVHYTDHKNKTSRVVIIYVEVPSTTLIAACRWMLAWRAFSRHIRNKALCEMT